MNYVFDACALIAYLTDEPGSDDIQDLLKKAIDGHIFIYMNIVNLVEVHYANIRSLGSAQAALILDKILTLPIRVISSTSVTVFHEASRLKALYKCSLADAFGLATAIELTGFFVTSDHHELETVETKENIAFFWLPPRPKAN